MQYLFFFLTGDFLFQVTFNCKSVLELKVNRIEIFLESKGFIVVSGKRL